MAWLDYQHAQRMDIYAYACSPEFQEAINKELVDSTHEGGPPPWEE